jgi:hypothetical protein
MYQVADSGVLSKGGWIDDEHISYWLRSGTWILRADGAGSARRLLTDASSSVVVGS